MNCMVPFLMITVGDFSMTIYTFEGGKAKVTDSGERKEVAGSGSEHWYWESDDWYYIDKQGNRCENQDTDKDKTHP